LIENCGLTVDTSTRDFRETRSDLQFLIERTSYWRISNPVKIQIARLIIEANLQSQSRKQIRRLLIARFACLPRIDWLGE
jgi:hypothetical protein